MDMIHDWGRNITMVSPFKTYYLIYFYTCFLCFLAMKSRKVFLIGSWFQQLRVRCFCFLRHRDRKGSTLCKGSWFSFVFFSVPWLEFLVFHPFEIYLSPASSFFFLRVLQPLLLPATFMLALYLLHFLFIIKWEFPFICWYIYFFTRHQLIQAVKSWTFSQDDWVPCFLCTF